MSKSNAHFTRIVSERTGIPRTVVLKVLEEYQEAIIGQLVIHEQCSIHQIGTLTVNVKEYKPSSGDNLRKGSFTKGENLGKVNSKPSKRVHVTFSKGAELKRRLKEKSHGEIRSR